MTIDARGTTPGDPGLGRAVAATAAELGSVAPRTVAAIWATRCA
jgi:hypothetical protein